MLWTGFGFDVHVVVGTEGRFCWKVGDVMDTLVGAVIGVTGVGLDKDGDLGGGGGGFGEGIG